MVKFLMQRSTRNSFPHPYTQAQRNPRILSSPSAAEQAITQEERYLVGEDLRPARMDQLLYELDKANYNGIINTYDKQAQGWRQWFRHVFCLCVRSVETHPSV